MENKLSKYSVIWGTITWLASLAGIASFNMYSSVKNLFTEAIFMPGVFETVLIVLSGAMATGFGLIAGVAALRVSSRRKLAWVAIFINGLYCFPVTILFLAQAIQ